MKKNIPRVAVLVDTSTSWGREVTEGVANYVQATRPWHLYLRPLGYREKLFINEGWKGDGIIARVRSRSDWKVLAAIGCPVINVSGVTIKGIDLPSVTVDDEACADMAIRHLKELGLTHFAHYVEHHQVFPRPHRNVLTQAFKRADLTCATYQPSRSVRTKVTWLQLRKNLGRWLEQLPKPVGIVCWGHYQARRLSELCLELGLMIPEEVAILGIDADTLMSTAVRPTLSEVNLQSSRQGYLASEMLDQLMQKKKLKQREIRLPPLGIAVHDSTDLEIIADPHLRKAVGFIRTHINLPITVSDVLKQVPLSRRVLERRFQSLLSRSPGEEIRRARLAKTRQLVEETHLSMPEVASASGWASVEYMIPVFKKAFSLTPLQYRKQVQNRSQEV